jgi:hypothetical protein
MLYLLFDKATELQDNNLSKPTPERIKKSVIFFDSNHIHSHAKGIQYRGRFVRDPQTFNEWGYNRMGEKRLRYGNGSLFFFFFLPNCPLQVMFPLQRMSQVSNPFCFFSGIVEVTDHQCP